MRNIARKRRGCAKWLGARILNSCSDECFRHAVGNENTWRGGFQQPRKFSFNLSGFLWCEFDHLTRESYLPVFSNYSYDFNMFAFPDESITSILSLHGVSRTLLSLQINPPADWSKSGKYLAEVHISYTCELLFTNDQNKSLGSWPEGCQRLFFSFWPKVSTLQWNWNAIGVAMKTQVLLIQANILLREWEKLDVLPFVFCFLLLQKSWVWKHAKGRVRLAALFSTFNPVFCERTSESSPHRPEPDRHLDCCSHLKRIWVNKNDKGPSFHLRPPLQGTVP